MTPDTFLQPTLEVKEEMMVLKGAIIFKTVVDIWQKGIAAIQQMQKIQVDLGQLVQCDSSVLALCTAWMRVAYRQKKQLIFLNVPEFMQDLIRVHGLDAVLPKPALNNRVLG